MDDELQMMDDRGFAKGTCPKCRRTIYSDTGFWECDQCGYTEVPELETEKDNYDEDC